ncbi:MAG: single-stranded-DNA-specific exonuclease [Chlamydiales bacterium]
MGNKFREWKGMSLEDPKDFDALKSILERNRGFQGVDTLDYGDHGLLQVIEAVSEAIRTNQRIGLYSDYDVDGTMSCVSWIWFFQAIGFDNYTHYIPCRFKEGYGLNLDAMKLLIDEEKVELIITMDTGITANAEAAYCIERGVKFICTDHHSIQPDKMPDCIILNPKFHPDENYQELCGCGITFVLLRKLGMDFSIPPSVWTDILALTGMATICDIVPLNGVNHKLAKMGVAAVMRSQRPVLKKLREACSALKGIDEKDVGFRLGPRINAVGRLEHADYVIQAFVHENPDQLINFMEKCNEKRKLLQDKIVKEARKKALESPDSPILFLGGDWHPGVVGIAASKIAEEFWCPVWLFQKKDGQCKGSARSIPNFDVTKCMGAADQHFLKYGGHKAAGGYTFEESEEENIRKLMTEYASKIKENSPELWVSQISYDCHLPQSLMNLSLTDSLDALKPFGHGFEEPRFCVDAEILKTQFYNDKSTGKPRHTAVTIQGEFGEAYKVMFFNEVHEELMETSNALFLVSATRNTFRGSTSLSLMGHDFEVS